MPHSQKTILLAGGGVAALGLFIFFAGKFFTTHSTPVVPALIPSVPAMESNATPKTTPTTGSTVHIAPDSEADSLPSVRYNGTAFMPREIIIGDKSSDTPCVVRIENISREPLTIRLGPVSKKDDRGFPYPTILARQSSLIDPRYHLPLVSFYSREHPTLTFTVKIEGACR